MHENRSFLFHSLVPNSITQCGCGTLRQTSRIVCLVDTLMKENISSFVTEEGDNCVNVVIQLLIYIIG